MQRPINQPSGSSTLLSNNTIQRENRQNLLTSHGDGDDNLTDFEEEDDYRENHRGQRGEATQEDAGANDSNKHWLWGNWILLAILGMLSFSSCNMFIGELATMGMESIYYFCSGSLLFSVLFFLYQKEWKKLNAIN